MVLVAITPMRRSDPASVEPGLKPNHPKHRMKVPTRAMGMLWPGIALADPAGLYLPRRGPGGAAAASAIIPPAICTTDEPAKSPGRSPGPRCVPDHEGRPPAPVRFRRVGQ